MFTLRSLFAGLVLIAPTAIQAADEPIALQEKFAPGLQYRVSCRFSGTGKLTLPPDKDSPAGRTLEQAGKSLLEYDERILDAEPGGEVRKTLRVFRQVDFQKSIGKEEFRLTIRPAVRRMVLQREKGMQGRAVDPARDRNRAHRSLPAGAVRPVAG